MNDAEADFRRLVAAMRGQQKRFFEGDRSSAVIREAKRLERLVDQALADGMSGQQQGSLWTEESPMGPGPRRRGGDS